MLRRLLVPLDGSAVAETVLPWALFLAREKGLSLTLARVVGNGIRDRARATGQALATSADVAVDGRWERARTYLDAVRERLAGDDVDVEIAICEGTPVQTLLDLVDQIDASAIVLATHGEGSTRDHPLGAVTEQILQEATVPVLLIPTGRGVGMRPPSLQRLMVPLDGSTLAERALDVSAELASQGSSVRLVRIVEPAQETLDTAEGRLPLEDAETTSRAQAEAAAYLRSVQRTMDGNRPAIQTAVELGRPDRQILISAHDQAIDLIVMVTHGASGPGRAWLGSVANDVVRRSSVPVFLVSARALVARGGRSYRVADVMTREVVAMCEDDPLDVVLRRLLRHRISGAPVVSADGTLVGVITEQDLLRWQLDAVRARSGKASTELPSISDLLKATRTAAVMSHVTVSVDESMQLASALPILLKLPYRRLPVTHHGRLVGVLSRADVLKAMVEQDAAALESLALEASGVS